MGKIIITGTGRSGTSFLVHLLSALGMDTGYTEEECFKICNNVCQAGAEHTIEKPYKILKNPEFMVDIEEIVENHDIDHVIIPIRKLDDVGRSRENNADNHGGFGGFWNGCDTKEQQINADSKALYNMIEVLTRNDIPFTTISFPLMVEDELYLNSKLSKVFTELEIFEIDLHPAFNRIANPDKITIK